MAGTRKVICQYCREKFSREEFAYEKDSKGYYHKTCYDNMQEERANRAGILEFLEELTPGQVNYPLVRKQIKEYTEKFPYTESGLLGTLHYMVEVKRRKVNPKTGIAFLPYLYNEARAYYESLAKMGDIEKIENEEKVVVVSQQESKRLSKLIDIEALLLEDD